MKVKITGGRPLQGSLEVPADKSITHRSLMFSALAEGTTRVVAMHPGEDNFSTATVLRQLGVGIEATSSGWTVQGVGLSGLRAPPSPLDCGNSGTTMRLMAGILAGGSVRSTLVGDASLSGRPMGRVCRPLRELGCGIVGQSEGGGETPPLHITPGDFVGGRWTQSVASAQVKSCVLLAGLMGGREVSVVEPSLSRDHTERMLTAMGVPVRTREVDGGWEISLGANPPAPRSPGELRVPGDISSAAFWSAAALLVPGSDLTIGRVGLNPSRTGCLDAFSELGFGVEMSPEAEVGGEQVGTLRVRNPGGDLPREEAVLGGALIPRLIDELVVLGALACGRGGPTVVRDAGELRVKESDRIAETARLLRAFGARVEEFEEGYRVEGGASLRAAEVDVGSDHRVALTAAVLAAAAPGESVLSGFDIANVSYPSFIRDFRAVGGELVVLDGGEGAG